MRLVGPLVKSSRRSLQPGCLQGCDKPLSDTKPYLQQEVQAADGGLHNTLVLAVQLTQQLRQAARCQHRVHAVFQLVRQAAHCGGGLPQMSCRVNQQCYGE